MLRLINGELARKPRRRQRGRTYGLEVENALRVIDESFDGGCAERLTPNLAWMAKHLAKHDELEITDELLEKLGDISISTTGRILGRIRQDHSPDGQEHFEILRERTNPRQLRKEIYALSNAVPGQTEDVCQTLFQAQKQN